MKYTRHLTCLALIAAFTVSAFAGIGTVAVGPTETTVLASSSQRTWLTLQNNSTNDIYVKIDPSTNAVTTTNGLKLAANGGSITIGQLGSVQLTPVGNIIKAISSTGTNNLSYQYGQNN